MKKSKVRQLFEHLKKNPNKLGYRDMQKFVYYLNNPKKTKCSKGYWCTNFAQLRYIGNITNDKNKKYFLTEQGLLNIKQPYSTKKQSTISQLEQFKKHNVELKCNLNYYISKNCELRNELRSLKCELYNLSQN